MVGPTSALTASRSPIGAYLKPPGSGSKPAWYFGCAVAVTVARVRPWKPPCEGDDVGALLVALHLVLVAAGQLDQRLVRLRAGVAEERPRAGQPRGLGEPRGQLNLRLGVEDVRDVPEGVELLLHRGRHAPGGSGPARRWRCRRSGRGSGGPRRPTGSCLRRARARWAAACSSAAAPASPGRSPRRCAWRQGRGWRRRQGFIERASVMASQNVPREVLILDQIRQALHAPPRRRSGTACRPVPRPRRRRRRAAARAGCAAGARRCSGSDR